MAIYGIFPKPSALLLPLLVLFIMLAALGVGLLLAQSMPSFATWRKLSFVMQIWLFLTPVVYPGSLVPESEPLQDYLRAQSAGGGDRIVPMGGCRDARAASQLRRFIRVCRAHTPCLWMGLFRKDGATFRGCDLDMMTHAIEVQQVWKSYDW